MTFNCADSFSADYAEARGKFREDAAAAGGALDAVSHPGLGPGGEALTTDVAWFGPRGAERALVLISGTHGVEGFCGSGAQVHWLRRGEAARLPAGLGVLMIHAVNPHGFAWLRRVTEDNVDLNRNWVDFEGPLPENRPYAEIHDALCPADWSEAGRARADAVLDRFAAEKGELALRDAITLGQHSHPDGLFFGGTSPSWSRRTQTAIYREHLGKAGQVGIIDFHTGLGPWGFGEQIVVEPRGAPAYERAQDWYGAAVVSPVAGDSSSADIKGDGLSAAPVILAHAEVTGMALEIGTLPTDEVRNALRADGWLHAHGDPTGPEAAPIKARIRAAFYGDADDWKGMVAAQSMLACRQAVAGLTRG